MFHGHPMNFVDTCTLCGHVDTPHVLWIPAHSVDNPHALWTPHTLWTTHALCGYLQCFVDTPHALWTLHSLRRHSHTLWTPARSVDSPHALWIPHVLCRQSTHSMDTHTLCGHPTCSVDTCMLRGHLHVPWTPCVLRGHPSAWIGRRCGRWLRPSQGRRAVAPVRLARPRYGYGPVPCGGYTTVHTVFSVVSKRTALASVGFKFVSYMGFSKEACPLLFSWPA